MGQILKLANVP